MKGAKNDGKQGMEAKENRKIKEGSINESQSRNGLEIEKRDSRAIAKNLAMAIGRDVLSFIEDPEFQDRYHRWKDANGIKNLKDAMLWKKRQEEETGNAILDPSGANASVGATKASADDPSPIKAGSEDSSCAGIDGIIRIASIGQTSSIRESGRAQ